MQLDKTNIAIRERNWLDILDLSLQVLRTHFGPLLLAAVVGIAPMMLCGSRERRPLYQVMLALSRMSATCAMCPP